RPRLRGLGRESGRHHSAHHHQPNQSFHSGLSYSIRRELSSSTGRPSGAIMPVEMRRSIRRFLTLFRAGKAESDLAREIDGHLQLLEDDFVAKGMSREDAHFAARRAFGGVEQAKELQRD